MTSSNRVAESRRPDFAVESHLLMRRATWCGIVFALALLITVLNVVPPVDITYRIVSQAVVSETRLNQLHAEQKKPLGVAGKPTELGASLTNAGALKRVKVLDRVQEDGSQGLDAAAGLQLVLVEVESLWPERCNEDTYTTWFEQVTRCSHQELAGSELAKQLRHARWELQAAEHYASQYQFLKKANERDAAFTTAQNTTAASAGNGGRTFQLASSAEAVAATTPASGLSNEATKVSATLPAFNVAESPFTAGSSAGDSAADGKAAATFESLNAQVAAARRQVSETELAWQQQIQQASGDVRLSGAIQVLATPTAIPAWLAVSVLIVGLAAGASSGWFQYRLQSGGVYDPESVARQLEHVGIVAAGKLTLADIRGGNEDWMERASASANTTGRRLARNLSLISEIVVGVWFALIVFRLVADPLWRNVLLESPLAALGRLLTGMP